MSHGTGISNLALAPDGRRALSASYGDLGIKLWDLEKGRQLDTLTGHVGGPLGVAFSPDGRRALSSDSICCVRLWKLGR